MGHPTKVYKLTVCVIDFDEIGPHEAASVIENTKYPNWCIAPHVVGIDEAEVDWNDNHPLNNSTTSDRAFGELFGETNLTEENRDLKRRLAEKHGLAYASGEKHDSKTTVNISSDLDESQWCMVATKRRQ